ncbi:FecR family protein [Belliella marina]|uniref:FecR family protein n=1 Tax=Belliella marina TaxID=1644146 RepID=A0ABW4VN98_9BACT
MTEKDYFELLNRVLDGTATKEEKSLVDAFYERVSTVGSTQVGNKESLGKNKEAIFRKLNLENGATPPNEKTAIGFFPRIILGLAASITVVLVCWSLAFYYAQAGSYENMGEAISMVDLPDGSQVMLSPNSQISYYKNVLDGGRVVKLQGEGFFDVHKIKGSKFTVHFLDSKLEVLGTTFHVDARLSNEYQVGLFTGAVAVFPQHTKEKILMKPGQKLLVNPGLSKEGHQLLSFFDRDTDEKILRYDSIPLVSLMKVFDAQFGTKTNFGDSKLENQIVGGHFNFEEADDLLEQISFILNIKYEQHENQLTIYENKN